MAANPELHTLHSYLADLDLFLVKKFEEHKATIEQLQHIPMIEHDDNHDSLQYEWYALNKSKENRNLFFKSFIITLFTFLESSLMDCCRNIELEKKYRLTVKDLAGKGIVQSMNYLVKVHKIEYFLETSTEWSQLQDIQRLRNCLVHNSGKLDETAEQSQQLKKYIHRNTNLRIDESNGTIIVSKEYCEKSLLIVERYLYAIDKKLDELRNQSKGK